ncbi:hypothetical protein BJ508DRAFT_325687 [Ascobolus immersus RN42]|uniref:SGNH hydrolase n=1 Tax=Ascobolus immersus RN42 TaxID=1160509 RepID=A0A3N4I7U4_ASCIM|nr:hypothetical protein BJ508DRAFT_325687 [Ascobolus immersus RN42]
MQLPSSWSTFAFTLATLPLPPVSANIKLLILGDGISQYACWPVHLWRYLSYDNYTSAISFANSKTAMFSVDVGGDGSTDRVTNCYWDEGRDVNHWQDLTVGELAVRLPGWLEEYRPDVVLMHDVGRKDLGVPGSDVAGIVKGVDGLVETMRAGNPDVLVVVAKLSPEHTGEWFGRFDPSYRPTIIPAFSKLVDSFVSLLRFNMELEKWVKTKSELRSPVILEDLDKGCSPLDNRNLDGEDPVYARDVKIARAWWCPVVASIRLAQERGIGEEVAYNNKSE